MRASADPVLVRRLSAFASAASVLPIVIGLSVIAGWTLGVAVLLTWGFGTPMAPNAAACNVLAGVSLWLRRKHNHPPTRAGKVVAQSAAAIVAGVGLLTLAEHIFSVRFGIDRVLLRTPLAPELAHARILMSPIGAGHFLLFGLALLLIDWRTRRDDWPAQFLAFGAAMAPPFGLLGLLVGPKLSPMTLSLPAVLCYCLLNSGLICSRSTWAVGGLLTSRSLGARLLRGAVPPALLVLGLIGWFISKPLLTEEHFTWVEVSLLAVVAAVALFSLITWMAFMVERGDLERRRAETALRVAQGGLDGDGIDEPEPEKELLRKVNGAFAVALLLTGALGLLSWRDAQRAAADADWVAHTREVSATLELTLRHLLDVETGGRGFAMAGDEKFLEPYEKGRIATGQDLQTLSVLMVDNPGQLRQLDLLRRQADARIEATGGIIEIRRNSGIAATDLELQRGKTVMDAARLTVAQMEATEKNLLVQRTERLRETTRFTTSVIALGSVLGMVFLSVAGFTVSREIGVSARARAQVSALNAGLERRVAERTEALGESEGRLAGVIQSAMDAILTVDEEQNIILFNAAAERMFRCPAAEALGQPIKRFIPQRFHAAHAGHIHKFADTGVPSRAMGSKNALWAVRADGQEFQIEASISQVVTGGKKLFTVILRDVTERVQAEQAVREAQDRMTGIIASAMDSIITTDDEQRILVFNAAAERMFRCSAVEALGQSVTRFIPQRFHAAHGGHMKQFGEKGVTGRAMGALGKLWAVRADGEEFRIEASISHIEAAGKRLFTVILRDVTERVQAEAVREHLASVVDSSDDAIISKDLNGIINAWNRGAEKIFGYTAAEAVGKSMRMLYPRGRVYEEADILDRIRSGESVEHFETVRVRKDGTAIDISATISPIRDGSGAIVGASKIARDITESKRTQEALRQSDVRRGFALDTAKIGDWDLDVATLRASRSALHDQIFGYPDLLPEWSFDVFLRHIHPDDRERVRETFQSSVAAQKKWEFECRIVRPNGEIRWIWACGDQSRDLSGKATRMFGIVQDITERKQAEQALREQAQVLDLAQVLVRDMEGRVVLWNRGAENLYGFSKEDALGRLSHELLQTEFPEPQTRIEEKLRSSGSWEGELVHFKSDGTRIVVSSLWVLYRDEQGNPLRVLEANTDITARKQAEAQLAGQAEELSHQTLELDRSRQAIETHKLMLQSVLDSMQEGLVAADETGKFIIWNPAATKIVGMGAEDVPPGEWNTHYGVYRPDTITPFPIEQNPLTRALRGEVSTAEMFIRNPELEQGVWIEISGSPLKGADGSLRGGVAAFRDISQRKVDEGQIQRLNEELEERVAQRTAQLEAANHELEAFTYSVSHDLRAPLRHISGFAKILSEDFGSAMPVEARSHLQRVEDGVHRMGLLVDELLNLARVGRHAIKFQTANLNSLIEEVVSLLEPETQGRVVDWKIAELPSAECDPILVKQVFQNLIANALKFTRTRERAVIEIDHRQENGEDVVVIRDNGVGFNMKYQDKLFGVFQRLHKAEDFEGTGIGLATVQRIVHKHGGRVWAQAELDKGATFSFTLKAAKSTAAEPIAVTNTSAAAGGQL